MFVPLQADPKNYEPAQVLKVPINEDTDTYIVQQQDSVDIVELKKDQIRDMDPAGPINQQTNTSSFPLAPWICDGAKVTLFLPHVMSCKNQNKGTYIKMKISPGTLNQVD